MANGDLIKRLRKKHGMTQEQLGRILGVKKSAIQKYENGSIQNLKITTLRKLCLTFNVPAHVFVFGTDSEELFSKDFKNIIFHYYGTNFYKLTTNLYRLNEEGLRKVVVYSADLADLPRYRKKSEVEDQHEKP